MTTTTPNLPTSAQLATTAPALPPGPRFPTLMVNFLRWSPIVIKQDLLKFNLDTMKQYGNFTATVLGDAVIYIITDPDLAHEVAVTRADEFHKGDIVRKALGEVAPNGLLLSEGDFWKRQRKLAQPAFHHKRIDAYGQVTVEMAERLMTEWAQQSTLDIFHQMSELTLRVVNKTLFNVELSEKVEHIGELVTTVLNSANDKLYALDMLADRIQVFKHRRERRALAELNRIINGIIEEHRQMKEDNGDLLAMLLQARDDEGKPMDENHLRDEVMTLFLAGHETTANALTWTFYLLAQHPEAEAKLREEMARVVGGRRPTVADLPQMPYLEMVVKESMRLYPPAGGFSREPIHDLELGGYKIPKGSSIAVSTYAMHRNPQFFERPDDFDPERFSKEREASIPKYAYLPFGAGPRICIGNSFAMMESRLALVAIMQRYRLSLANNAPVQAEQVFTIRPKGRLMMHVTRL
jgi:cytochrome P450